VSKDSHSHPTAWPDSQAQGPRSLLGTHYKSILQQLQPKPADERLWRCVARCGPATCCSPGGRGREPEEGGGARRGQAWTQERRGGWRRRWFQKLQGSTSCLHRSTTEPRTVCDRPSNTDRSIIATRGKHAPPPCGEGAPHIGSVSHDAGNQNRYMCTKRNHVASCQGYDERTNSLPRMVGCTVACNFSPGASSSRWLPFFVKPARGCVKRYCEKQLCSHKATISSQFQRRRMCCSPQCASFELPICGRSTTRVVNRKVLGNAASCDAHV
jgi:hypothetical protein